MAFSKFWLDDFDRKGLIALQFFGYLKRQVELLIFNERFIGKNIRNLRINLRNKLLHS